MFFPATEVALKTVIERPVGNLIEIHTSADVAVAGKINCSGFLIDWETVELLDLIDTFETVPPLTSAKNGFAGIGTGVGAIGEALADGVAVATGVADGDADAVGFGVADGVGVGVGLGVGVGAASVRRGRVITRRGTEPPRNPAPTTSKVPKVIFALYSLKTVGRDLSNVLMMKSPSLASKSSAPAREAQIGPKVLSPSLS